jgi:Tol biopolymer transport system component
MADASPVPLSEFSAHLKPVEAVTIVRELALLVTRGTIPGVPSLQVVRLCPSGAITVEGPVAADGHEVTRAAHLLDTLLPSFDDYTGAQVPGVLRSVVARARGTLGLPPYPSLEEFAETLSRFAASDSERCIRELIVSRRQRLMPTGAHDGVATAVRSSDRSDDQMITISDIRRARRSTGLTLADISERVGLPALLLCELEWGYLHNWPASPAVRRHLVNYARAAGLDDQLVVRAVWPLFEESLHARGCMLGSRMLMSAPIVMGTVDEPAAVATVVDGEERTIAMIHPALAARHSRRRSGIVAAVVIPALLAISLAPAVWEPLVRRDHAPAAPPTQPTRNASIESGADLPIHAVDRGERGVAHRSVSDGPALYPALASDGGAVFSHAESNGEVAHSGADSRRSILRITSVADPNARNFHARPSPDGTRIAFDSDRDGQRGVYVADVDGRNVRRVSGGGFAAIPSWSPDGGTLAFVRAEPDRPDVWNLWTVDVASGRTRRLTSHRTGQAWGGSWFPDGDRIAYGYEDRLVVTDLTTGAEREYRSPLKGTRVRASAVAPDGRRIVFQVYRKGTWLLDLRKETVRKVMADPSAEDYTWAPDGRRVAYHSRGEGKWGVWVMGPSNP